MKNWKIVQTHSFFRVCLFLIIIMTFVANSGAACAEETENNANSLNVTLQPNDYTEVDKDINFSLEKGRNYLFHVIVSNTGNSPIDVSIFSSIGQSTSDSINYVSKSDRLLNERYNLTNYTTISHHEKPLKDNLLTLEPKESKTIEVKLNIPLDSELTGELLGGINFSQVIGAQENKSAVDVVKIYQKVITVRLKISELAKEKKVPLEYKEFNFSTSKNTTNLTYMVYNNNPLVHYSDHGTYRLINPNDKVIGKGNLAYKNTILTPYTKTEMTGNLINGAELISGTYQFITTVEGKEKINTFDYTEKDIQKFLADNQNENSITVSKDTSKILVFLVLLFAGIIICLAVKSIILKQKKHKK